MVGSLVKLANHLFILPVVQIIVVFVTEIKMWIVQHPSSIKRFINLNKRSKFYWSDHQTYLATQMYLWLYLWWKLGRRPKNYVAPRCYKIWNTKNG